MISLFKFLRSIQPLSNEFRDHLEDNVKHKNLVRKEYLLKGGQICKNIYFVENGLLRSYYYKGGKEISSRFISENEICVSTESFFTQEYGFENIQALEDCTLYYIEYEELNRISKYFPESNIISKILLQKCLLLKEQRLTAMWMQMAHDRLNWFSKYYPALLERVPAKYLASYLGMTEGMLSKIKSPHYEPFKISNGE